jgi:hypothetical protein
MIRASRHATAGATMRRLQAAVAGLTAAAFASCAALAADPAPVPLLTKDGQSVDWWFVFKFNSSKSFAGCGPRDEAKKKKEDSENRQCIFGGKVQTKTGFGQQFAVASSGHPKLEDGHGCTGATLTDPVGATFDQVYHGAFNYLIWNDQFYKDPAVKACKGDSCGAPWGHSKGLLAWNDEGEGFIMQVSTPAWPRSGSIKFDKRKGDKGNTLGCNSSNNNLRASQHFFALKLSKTDLPEVVKALRNASVVTDPTKLQIVRSGGPAEVRKLVDELGTRPKKEEERVLNKKLSSGVIMISKPSGLAVPPWQLVSAELNSANDKKQSNAAERAATWWTKPWIPTTTKTSVVECWDQDWVKTKDESKKNKEPLPTRKPGPVEIAKTGIWDELEINLTAPSNHAKIGTAIVEDKRYAVFGDMNQQGALRPPGCDKSQNGRGGLFFAVDTKDLFESVRELIDGETASTKVPSK